MAPLAYSQVEALGVQSDREGEEGWGWTARQMNYIFYVLSHCRKIVLFSLEWT